MEYSHSLIYFPGPNWIQGFSTLKLFLNVHPSWILTGKTQAPKTVYQQDDFHKPVLISKTISFPHAVITFLFVHDTSIAVCPSK